MKKTFRPRRRSTGVGGGEAPAVAAGAGVRFEDEVHEEEDCRKEKEMFWWDFGGDLKSLDGV